MLLTTNDDNKTPIEIRAIYTLTEPTDSNGSTTTVEHRFRCGYLLGARLENGKWTREKRARLTNDNSLFKLLHSWQRYGAAQFCFALPMAKTLSANGFWKSMESGDFSLSRMRKPNPLSKKSRPSRSRKEHHENGLLMEQGNQSAVVCYHRSRATYLFLDIRNYLDKPGKAIARLVSLPWPDEPHFDDSMESALQCSMQRCEVIFETAKLLMIWHKRQELGRIGLTTAGCAMAAFRHRGMMHDIEMPDDQEIRDYERAAYHGGRTEPLWIGEKIGSRFKPHPLSQCRPDLINDSPVGPFHVVDSSSFYGFIYADNKLPQRMICHGNEMSVDDAKKLITDDSWLAQCQIVSTSQRFPIKNDKGSHYANGRFTTTLCGPELYRAVHNGCVQKITYFAKYHCDYILNRYAEMLWNERKISEHNGNFLVAAWCKQLIAQLHGKFAQRNNRWQICNDIPVDEPWSKWSHWSEAEGRLIQYRSIGYEVQKSIPDGDAKICFPAIAAWVAACGRETLAMWEKIAGNHNTLYVATDSLLVTDVGLANMVSAGLLSDNQIGGLRVVESSDNVQIRGHGTYTIGGKIVTQGIKHEKSDKVFGTITECKSTGIEYAINHCGTPVIRLTYQEVEPGWNYDPMRVDDDGWLAVYNVVDGTAEWQKRKIAKDCLT